MFMDQLRRLSLAAALSSVLATVPASAAEVSEISAEDYHGAIYFQQALEHPAVQAKKTRKAQVEAVARDLKWPAKKLQAAVDEVEALGGDALELAKKALERGFEGTRVKGRVLDLNFDASKSDHVVLYLRFRGSNAKDALKDASTIAAVVSKEAPLVTTLSLAGIHPRAEASSTDPVWSAKIGRESMSRVQLNRIEDYADRLYKNLFEGVTEKPF
jgi:hypothetical protein